MNQLCPCCQRPLEKMLDYPLVSVRSIEVLPIPEVMDYWSEDAARAAISREQSPEDNQPGGQMGLRGINRTPEVALAYQSEAMQDYFRSLRLLQGQDVPSTKLLPELARDRYFKGAYPIPGTQLYVSLSDAEPQGEERVCQVALYGKGPNLGSAGGPTLQQLGVAAIIRYVGRLLGQEGNDRDGG